MTEFSLTLANGSRRYVDFDCYSECCAFYLGEMIDGVRVVDVTEIL